MSSRAARSSFLLRWRPHDRIGLRVELVELRGGRVRHFGSFAALSSFLRRSHPKGLK
jgi:hypothetical protein